MDVDLERVLELVRVDASRAEVDTLFEPECVSL